MISGVYGAGICAPSQKMHQEWAPIWNANLKAVPLENEGFQVCTALGVFAPSQKIYLEWAPVWSANWMIPNGRSNMDDLRWDGLKWEGLKWMISNG